MDESLKDVFTRIDQLFVAQEPSDTIRTKLIGSKSSPLSTKKSKSNTEYSNRTSSKRKPQLDKKTSKRPSYDADNFVSFCPLHIKQSRKTNIKKERLVELRKDHVINRGPWLNYECKILEENWSRIVKHHPEFSDPKFAFGEGHDQSGKLNAKQIRKLRRNYRRFNIIRRMAFRLDDRLICDIYSKCRLLFYDRSFLYYSRYDLPKSIDRAIRQDNKAKLPPAEIAYKYNVAPTLVKLIKRWPTIKNTIETGRYTWTIDAFENMKSLVEVLYSPAHISDLMSRDIRWKKVSKEMRSLGYNVRRKHCRYKWCREFPNSVQRRDELEQSSSETDSD